MAEVVNRERKKELPDMRGWSEEQIAEFWETHDSTNYLEQYHAPALDDGPIIANTISLQNIFSIGKLR